MLKKTKSANALHRPAYDGGKSDIPEDKRTDLRSVFMMRQGCRMGCRVGRQILLAADAAHVMARADVVLRWHAIERLNRYCAKSTFSRVPRTFPHIA